MLVPFLLRVHSSVGCCLSVSFQAYVFECLIVAIVLVRLIQVVLFRMIILEGQMEMNLLISVVLDSVPSCFRY